MLTDTHTMALKFDFSPKDKEIKKNLLHWLFYTQDTREDWVLTSARGMGPQM